MKPKKIIAAIALAVTLFTVTPINTVKASASTTQYYYTIQSTDTLWKVSKAFNVTVEELKKWNNLSSDIIYAGNALKIAPVHVVASGDSLWTISRMYGTTIDNLIKLNNMTSSTIYAGQVLIVGVSSLQQPIVQAPAPSAPTIQTVNYKVVPGDNLWTLAQKYGTTMDTIMKSNMLVSDILMPNQILTIPVKSIEIVKPVGITMMKARLNNNYGDIYTWENAMRLWTVNTTGTLRDLSTGKTFNISYYGGSNHSDIVTLTQTDTNIMKSVFGTWSWTNKKPMILSFTKGGVNYQMAVSLTGMPHGDTNNYSNGMSGHCDLYFYNSVGHSNPVIDPAAQANILKANGQ